MGLRKDGMSGPTLAALVESVLGIATILALVAVSVPTARPWAVVVESLRRTVRSRPRQLYLLVALVILLANYFYLASGLDEHFRERTLAWRGGEDFTPLIHRAVEGDAVARIQAAVTWRPLTFFFAYVYVVAFPCLAFASALVLDERRDRRGLVLVLLGYLFNYLLVMPFYVGFPVLECHEFYRQTGLQPAARLLLDDIAPAIMASYRTMSGLDNCFPSFHTSLALTMALIAWRGGPRCGALITFLAVSNVLSTVYLGIHWLADVAAGILTAALAYGLARLASKPWDRISDLRSPIADCQLPKADRTTQ